MAKHTVIRISQLYADDQELWKIEICHLSKENSDTSLPCTSTNAKFVYSPAEVNIYRKIYLDHSSQNPKTQQALNELYEEYRDILP